MIPSSKSPPAAAPAVNHRPITRLPPHPSSNLPCPGATTTTTLTPGMNPSMTHDRLVPLESSGDDDDDEDENETMETLTNRRGTSKRLKEFRPAAGSREHLAESHHTAVS